MNLVLMLEAAGAEDACSNSRMYTELYLKRLEKEGPPTPMN